MPLLKTAGSKLYIGGTAVTDKWDDFVAADFTTQTWTEISGVEDLGTAGDKASVISVNVIGSDRTKKLPGTRDAGQMTVVTALDPADAGQLAAIAALGSSTLSAFKLEFPDKGTGTGAAPTTRLFAAYVSSAEEGYSSANNEMKLTLVLEINSNVVAVAAVAGS
jgi:hypothetical protein